MSEPNRPKAIPDYLPTWELLAMVAEEAAELAQAALKLRRTLDDLNPTRMTFNQALAAFHEEWADVLLSIRQLNLIDENLVYQIMREKHDRWLNHLRETYDEPENRRKGERT